MTAAAPLQCLALLPSSARQSNYQSMDVEQVLCSDKPYQNSIISIDRVRSAVLETCWPANSPWKRFSTLGVGTRTIQRKLQEEESFSSDAGINVMVINVQAFNATGKDARRIYEELDDFQSRKPIDVISAN